MRSLMWTPPVDCTAQETALLSYMTRTRKLFGFLRRHRHELFDTPFQQQLIGMYDHPDAGKVPLPPALLAMALVLQAYLRVSHAELVQLALVDLRVQQLLGRLGGQSPAYSQGAPVNFGERLIAHDLDRRQLRSSKSWDCGFLSTRAPSERYRLVPSACQKTGGLSSGKASWPSRGRGRERN